MAEDIISQIRENVIQGRVTQDDEGLDEGMVGQPAVSELIDKALALGLDVKDIIQYVYGVFYLPILQVL